MMAGMKFIKTLKPAHAKASLRVMLHEHLTGYEPARPLTTIHASSMTKSEGFCPRFYAILQHEPKLLRDEWLSASEQLTYQIGRDVQDNIVHWFADMGRAVGHWKCLACEKVHHFQKRPAKCEKCPCKSFKPVEVRFVSEKTGASCGIDMLVALPDKNTLTPVEIKTIDKEEFKSLKTILAEHRLRSNLYLRIIDESKHSWANEVDTSLIKVLYATKGGYGCMDPTLAAQGISDKFTPFKEYEVTRDDKHTDDISRRAEVVTLYRKNEIGIPEGICSTALVPRAQKCVACKSCFSGEYPAEFQWKS